VCMVELRSALSIENVRGRMSDVRRRGYALNAKDSLPLCECHNTQLYRLDAMDPVRPPRVKIHGGMWSRDNWGGLTVAVNSTGLSKDLTDSEKRVIQDRVEAALLAAEAEIDQGRATPVFQKPVANKLNAEENEILDLLDELDAL
jgi:hypothetical protein